MKPRRQWEGDVFYECSLREHSHMTSDIFDLPTYPNQMFYYISLFSKIRCSLTYLPKYLTSYVNAP